VKHGPAFQDLTGYKYGKLTVLYLDGIYKSGTKWVLQCECGKTVIRLASNFKKKQHRHSCGCEPTNPGKKDAGLRRMYADYKTSAQKRGYAFDISLKTFKLLIFQKCNYCNAEPSDRYSGWIAHNFKANGIDRVNNSVGYSKDNCVTCCSNCNRAKGKMSEKEFLDWVKLVFYNCTRVKETSNV
jgi:5-methylcytosine-specific restriction endonuclease McrA